VRFHRETGASRTKFRVSAYRSISLEQVSRETTQKDKTCDYFPLLEDESLNKRPKLDLVLCGFDSGLCTLGGRQIIE
jgi:hypothetical protein